MYIYPFVFQALVFSVNEYVQFMEKELKIRVMAKKMLQLQRFESSKYQKNKQGKFSLAIIQKICFIASS